MSIRDRVIVREEALSLLQNLGDLENPGTVIGKWVRSRNFNKEEVINILEDLAIHYVVDGRSLNFYKEAVTKAGVML